MTVEPESLEAEVRATTTFGDQLALVRRLELEGAAPYLRAAEALADAARAPDLPASQRIQALSELGNAKRVSGDLAGARTVFSEVIEDAGRLPAGRERTGILALAHLRHAIVHDLGGSIIDASVHLDHATRHFEEAGDQAGQARCDNVRAAIYMRIDEFEDAESCYLRALDYYRKAGEAERVAVVLTNLAGLLRYMNRHEEAVAFGREAVELAQSTLLRATAVGNLAFAMAETGDLDEALHMARETEEAISEVGDPGYSIMFRRAVATILTKKGEPAEARDLLLAALSESEEKGYQSSVRDSHGLLADAYRELGDFENAYRHLRSYHELVLAESQKKAASQLEVHRSRLELESVRRQAEHERASRRELAESLAELSGMHERLSTRAVELEWRSYRDSLTELANRRYFDDRLGSFTKHSLETGEDLSIVLIDLDRFKGVNDTYGHGIGDEVLRATARILESGIRRSDLAARMGGEEFAILLSSDIHPGDLHAMADKLRRTFAGYDWNSVAPGLKVTVSIGTASLREVGGNPMKLLELADQRLYAAKRAGRNTVVSS